MFNRLKALFRSDPPPTHKIVQCETKLLDSADGPKHCMMIAADLHVPAALDVLVGELVERFKLHRMISSPDTSLLLVTIIGPCEPADFVSRWQEKVESDQIATVWMKRMEKADLGVAPAKGAVIPVFYSLLPSS